MYERSSITPSLVDILYAPKQSLCRFADIQYAIDLVSGTKNTIVKRPNAAASSGITKTTEIWLAPSCTIFVPTHADLMKRLLALLCATNASVTVIARHFKQQCWSSRQLQMKKQLSSIYNVHVRKTDPELYDYMYMIACRQNPDRSALLVTQVPSAQSTDLDCSPLEESNANVSCADCPKNTYQASSC